MDLIQNKPNALSLVKKVLLVLSSKGGVGKSTVCTQLAISLANEGKRIGVLDGDLCGPSMGLMFNSRKNTIINTENGWQPVIVGQENPIKLMSIAFLTKDEDDAIIWRGPKKNNMIKQFLMNVNWGELDYLIIDTPPGTSDEHISFAEILRGSSIESFAILVTTPQLVAVDDVRRQVEFCKKANLKILGLIENMSDYICPCCSESTKIFSTGGGKALANYSNIPFLGSIPIDPDLVSWLDEDKDFFQEYRESKCAKIFLDILKNISN